MTSTGRSIIGELGRLVDDALDAERIRLPEPTRGRVIRRLAELLTDAGYEPAPNTKEKHTMTYTPDNDHQADDVVTRGYLDERRQILAERGEQLLERWADEDADHEVVASAPTVTPEVDTCS